MVGRYVDSIAVIHTSMYDHIEWFVDYKQLNNNVEVRIGNGTKVTAYGKCDIINYTCLMEIRLKYFLHVPEIMVPKFILVRVRA